MEQPTISEFYAGRSIFITGFSGFLGKVLVEKLLRSCPDVKVLYVLIRPKKGQDGYQRVESILNSKMFEHLQREVPDYRKKVVPVCGDMMEENMGICDEDRAKIVSEVSVVFHSAATVKFDEVMSLSIQLNVLGVKKLIALCHQIVSLDSLIHVSTAYANCDQVVDVYEKVYDPPIHPDKLLEAVEWMEDDIFEELTPKLLGRRPNTYTFTKALAEYLLVEQASDLPLAIVRPSVVGGSWKEPLPGWVDNFNGPTGIMAAIGKGVLRTMLGDVDAIADIVPVDIVVNFMVASAWYTATEKPSQPLVYNCTTGMTNPTTWGFFERRSFDCFMKHPVDNISRIPDPRLTKSRLWYELKVLFDHKIPAVIIDLYLKCVGKKPIFVRLNEKLFKAVKTLEFFTSNEWRFHNDNLLMVLGKMCKEDRTVFDFDVKPINWAQYFENYGLGVKVFLLKEELSGLPEARKTLNRLQNFQLAMKIVGVLVALRLLMTRVKVARRLWYFFVSLAVKLFKLIPGIATA